jgi:DNA-binding IclR family transcriptional regulator
VKVQESAKNVTSSAVKVLEGLRILCEAQGSVSLGDFRTRLGVSEATAYRVFQTLVSTGFAQPSPSGSGYEPTLEIVRLGDLVTKGDHLADAIRSGFRPVNQKFQEPVTVGVPDGDFILFVKKLSGPRDPNFTCDVGVRLPMHIGAAARCILAHAPEEFFEAYLERRLAASDQTGGDILRAQMREDRDFIRENGYSISLDEVDVGISAIGVPILNRDGSVLGAVAIANVTARWDSEAMTTRAAEMRAAAAATSTLVADLPSLLAV